MSQEKVHRSEQERKMIFLVNPVSGTSKKDFIVELIKKTVSQLGIYFEIHRTNEFGNYDDIAVKIQNEKITDIIIVGGDGTVNHVIGALNKLDVRFGIIPYGSGNGLARAAGIPTKPEKALNVVLNGTAKKTDAFLVNGKFACMLAGLGFDAQVAHDFSKKSSRGLLTYAQQSIINFFKAQPYPFEIEIDGFKFCTEAFFISIANANQFGNNFTIAPKAKLDDGLLDIVVVQKMKKVKLPLAVLKQIRGNNRLEKLVDDILNKNILYFQTYNIKIRNPKLAPLHIDGEPTKTEENIVSEVLHRNFSLISSF